MTEATETEETEEEVEMVSIPKVLHEELMNSTQCRIDASRKYERSAEKTKGLKSEFQGAQQREETAAEAISKFTEEPPLFLSDGSTNPDVVQDGKEAEHDPGSQNS